MLTGAILTFLFLKIPFQYKIKDLQNNIIFI